LCIYNYMIQWLRGDKMEITLNELLDRAIFKKYTILSGAEHMDRPVESVSILETPEFERYIIDRSLVLTTFYPIKNDIEQAKKLLHTLKRHETSGIIIKVKRYIDTIPKSIVELAESLNIPLITLDYDANLSTLFNNILSEIQTKDYSNLPFDESYANLLQSVYENPTTKTLMKTVEEIPDLELLIQNLESKTTHYTSSTIRDYYESFKHTKNLIKRIDEMLYYSEDVIYDKKPIYRMVFLAKNDRRHIIHNTTEIFKMMIILIYQKKMENSLKLNQFLHNFVSDYSTRYNNQQLLEASKDYNWNLVFPVSLILFDIRDDEQPTINPSLIDYIRTVLLNKFHLKNDEIKYTYMNKQLLFIINIDQTINMDTTLHNSLERIERKFPDYSFLITHSDPIHNAPDIASSYRLLNEALRHAHARNLNVRIFSEQSIELLNLLKNIDFTEIKNFVRKVLKPLIEYEKKHQIPLIQTLHAYIKHKFSAKQTSQHLFIHYNSLRYRLSIIESMGYDINGSGEGFFDLYFALYLNQNFLENT